MAEIIPICRGLTQYDSRFHAAEECAEYFSVTQIRMQPYLCPYCNTYHLRTEGHTNDSY